MSSRTRINTPLHVSGADSDTTIDVLMPCATLGSCTSVKKIKIKIKKNILSWKLDFRIKKKKL